MAIVYPSYRDPERKNWTKLTVAGTVKWHLSCLSFGANRWHLSYLASGGNR